MLRDRTPAVVIFALKWCKATNEWVDHAYKNFVKIYASKKERDNAVRILLGIDHDPRKFVFEDTIDWDNISNEEKSHWEYVTGWVSWFQSKHSYIQNAYEISKKVGKDIADIKLEIITKYLSIYCPTTKDSDKVRELKNKFVNALADFLIDTFENQIKR